MNKTFEATRLDLIDFIKNKYTQMGLISTNIKSLDFYKETSLPEFSAVMYEPSLCLILQGKKAVGFADEMFSYSPYTYLLSSTHIPANVKIQQASKEVPYISLKLSFTIEQIYDVIKELKLKPCATSKKLEKALYFGEMSDLLMNPISRLIKLLDTTKENIKFMSPLIIKEIIYVLLQDESGEFLKQYVMEGSNTNKIAKVISNIKNNFAQSLKIDELAKQMNMSESSLYYNFKSLTTMSPLQYQKKLRLEEAKVMLLNKDMDASQVAFDVGYESPSQFSREYSRMFGLPPKAHITFLKDSAL